MALPIKHGTWCSLHACLWKMEHLLHPTPLWFLICFGVIRGHVTEPFFLKILFFFLFFFKVVVGIPFYFLETNPPPPKPCFPFFHDTCQVARQKRKAKKEQKLGFMISKKPSTESFTGIRPTQGGIGPMRVESGPYASAIRPLQCGIWTRCECNKAHVRWNRAHTRCNRVQCEWNQAPWEWDQAHARGNHPSPKASH